MRKRNMISKAAAMGLAVLTAASLTLTGCSQPAGDKETAQETQQTAQAAESETQAPEAAQTQAEAGQTTAAQAAGEAALLENNYLKQSVSYIRKERQFLKDALERFQLQVYGGRANYLFFYSGRADLKAAFLEWGILIRDCGNYRGLFAGYYRIAVRTHEENQQFVRVLEQVFGKKA